METPGIQWVKDPFYTTLIIHLNNPQLPLEEAFLRKAIVYYTYVAMALKINNRSFSLSCNKKINAKPFNEKGQELQTL